MVLRGSCSAVFSLIVKSLVFLFLMIISFLIYITEPCPWRAIPHYLLYCADDWAAVEGDGWFRWDQIQSPLPHQHSTHPQATTCPGLWASTFVFCLPLFSACVPTAVYLHVMCMSLSYMHHHPLSLCQTVVCWVYVLLFSAGLSVRKRGGIGCNGIAQQAA